MVQRVWLVVEGVVSGTEGVAWGSHTFSSMATEAAGICKMCVLPS